MSGQGTTPAQATGGRSGDAGAHLLVVDDDRRLRALLERYLTREGFLVTTAADVEGARAVLSGMRPDLVVLDVMLPGTDGVTFTSELHHGLGLPVLLLTALGGTDDRIRGLEAGADDYLPKPFEPRELVLRVRTVLRRGGGRDEQAAPEAAPTVAFGRYSFDAKRRELKRDGEPVHLTTGEAALLARLAAQPDVAVARAELALEGGSERAVDVQITRLRRKLDDDPREPRHLLTVRGEGYVLRTGG